MTLNDKPKKAPKPAPAQAPTPASRTLTVPQRPGVTYDRSVCDLMTEGVAPSGSVMTRFLAADFGEVSLTDLVASLSAQGEAVNAGDLGAAERMLSAQAAALNAIFGELARRAALNLGEYLGAAETYLRLALRAQNQSRSTVETLAAIKNPPVVFARQANINNGGQQQVVNGPHALENQTTPNELLEELNHARSPLDTRTAPATSREDSRLEPMAAVKRPAHGSRQSGRVAQRLEGRASGDAARTGAGLV